MTTIKPVLIVPVGTFQKGDMERLNDNFFCVVEAKDPAAVKFLDPIPSAAERTKIEEAAIILSRRLLSNNLRSFSGEIINLTRENICKLYVEILSEGTKLDQDIDKSERIFSTEKRNELERLAREEARAERAAEKAKKLASTVKPKGA